MTPTRQGAVMTNGPTQWFVGGSVIGGTESWFQCSPRMSLRVDMYC